MQRPPTISPLPTKLSSNILDTLVPNLVPNLNKLKPLGYKV